MALTTESFTADGSTKIFTPASTILSQSHARVDYYYSDDGIVDATDHEIPSSIWDVINNSIVFNDAPTLDYVVKISISTDGEGLDAAPSANSTILSNITEIITVANNLDNEDTIGTVAGSIDNVNLVGTDITNVNTVATNITNVNTVAANDAAITAINNNLTELLSIDTKADEALQSALEAANSATLADVARIASELAAATAASTANVTAWVSGFAYTAGDVTWSLIDFQTYRATVDVTDTIDPSIDNTWTRISTSGDVTDAPEFTLSTVNEGSTTTFTVSNHVAGTEYTINAIKGTISNVSGATFDYTAPDITDDLDTTDHVYMYAETIGALRSETITEELDVIFVSIVADDAIQVVNMFADVTVNDGYEEVV